MNKSNHAGFQLEPNFSYFFHPFFCLVIFKAKSASTYHTLNVEIIHPAQAG